MNSNSKPDVTPSPHTLSEVSVFRLYLLRATYLLLVVGLGLTEWPAIINHAKEIRLSSGVVSSILGAVAVLAVIGIRYPLTMLPLFLFELIWKAIWLVAFALPLWLDGEVTPAIWESIYACGMGIIIMPIVIPWSYVWANYVKKPGDRWR